MPRGSTGMNRTTPILIMLVAAALVWAKPLRAGVSCRALEGFQLTDPDMPGVLMTTPPYVGLNLTGELLRLAHRTRPLRYEIPLSPNRAACLEALMGARLKALRAGTSYRLKLQTSEGALLVYHVADLSGGEALVSEAGRKALDRAAGLLKAGDLSGAAGAYSNLLENAPTPFEASAAHTFLGLIENEEGRPESARRRFEAALEAYPGYVPAQLAEAALPEFKAQERPVATAPRKTRKKEMRKPPEPSLDAAAARRPKRKLPEAPTVVKASAKQPERVNGSKHLKVASALQKAAELYLVTGQAEEAESLYWRSLAIREKALGPDHLEVAESLDHLADLHAARGQYDRAAKLWARALSIRERVLGPDHPRVTATGAALAEAYSRTGKKREAKELIKRIKESRPESKGMGAADITTGSGYVSQGTLFTGLDHPERAVGPFNRATDIDPESRGSYMNRGSVYEMGEMDLEKACRDFQRACELGKCAPLEELKDRGLCK